MAPAIPELLSGSSPVTSFFTPLGLVLIGIYGTGALLVRETARRRGLGWTSILLLGAAYGIIEEGLQVQSFFNEHHWDLGNWAIYSRAWGVNWGWAMSLTIVHAIWSITIPIALTEVLFPTFRTKPWLGRRSLWAAAIVIALDVAGMAVLFAFMFNKQWGYTVPIIAYLLTILLAAALVALALVWPKPGTVADPRFVRPPPRPWSLRVFGLTAGAAYMVIPGAMSDPKNGVPVGATLATIALIPAIAWWLLSRWSGPGRTWDDRHSLALCAGPVALFALWSILVLPHMQRPDKDFAGQPIVGLVALALLTAGSVWVGHRSQPTLASTPCPAGTQTAA
jgi:hypothetical protein